MKKRHFYTHLIQINDITLDLADIDMSPEERLRLLSLIDANVHTSVVNTVLSELPGDEKKVFLKNLVKDDHEKTWVHLKQNTRGLEEKIKKTADNLIKEMRKDIKKVKIKK